MVTFFFYVVSLATLLLKLEEILNNSLWPAKQIKKFGATVVSRIKKRICQAEVHKKKKTEM